MKKASILVLTAALLLAGCSGNKEEKNAASPANSSSQASPSPSASPSEEPNPSAEASPSAEESGAAGAGEVSIVFPASLNESGDVEGMTAEVKEAGATGITENGDGSVTATISQENLDKLLQKYHSELLSVIEGVQSADAASTSIRDLSYDENTFQEYSITVDRAAYESEESVDGLVIFGLAMQSLMYQVYSGVQEADIKVIFNLIDESTGEVFDTTVLPEAAPAQ
jgi:hypothetical protein